MGTITLQVDLHERIKFVEQGVSEVLIDAYDSIRREALAIVASPGEKTTIPADTIATDFCYLVRAFPFVCIKPELPLEESNKAQTDLEVMTERMQRVVGILSALHSSSFLGYLPADESVDGKFVEIAEVLEVIFGALVEKTLTTTGDHFATAQVDPRSEVEAFSRAITELTVEDSSSVRRRKDVAVGRSHSLARACYALLSFHRDRGRRMGPEPTESSSVELHGIGRCDGCGQAFPIQLLEYIPGTGTFCESCRRNG